MSEGILVTNCFRSRSQLSGRGWCLTLVLGGRRARLARENLADVAALPGCKTEAIPAERP